MTDLKKMLSPDDMDIFNANTTTNWVPKEPLDVLLPYMEETPPEEKNDLEKRRDKAKKVMEEYGKLIDESKQIEDQVSERCKNVKVVLDRRKHHRVIQAIARIFQIPESEATEITFEMYKTCVQRLDALTDERIPAPQGAEQP